MSLTESAETLLSRENSNPNDELSTLRRCLKFVLVDFGGNCWASCLSWIIFGILAIVVPIATGVSKFRISLLTVEEVTLQVNLFYFILCTDYLVKNPCDSIVLSDAYLVPA